MSSSYNNFSTGSANTINFPVYTGRRTTSAGTPSPSVTDVRYILQAVGNQMPILWRRQGNQWVQVNGAATTRYIFYDMPTEMAYLVNFGNSLGGTLGGQSSAGYGLGQAGTGQNTYGLGYIRPSNSSSNSSNSSTTPNNASGVTSTNCTTTGPSYGLSNQVIYNNPNGTSGVSTVGISNGLTSSQTSTGMFGMGRTSDLVSGVSSNLPVTANSTANTIQLTSLGTLFSTAPTTSGTGTVVGIDPNSANITAFQLNDSTVSLLPQTVLGAPNPQVNPSGMLLHGVAEGKSTVTSGDAATYIGAHFSDCSEGIAHQDGGSIGGAACKSSSLASKGIAAMARGLANCNSAIHAGGAPDPRYIPKGNNLSIIPVSRGALAVTYNTVNALYRSRALPATCPNNVELLEDTARNNRNFGTFGSNICIDNGEGDDAPGLGHGCLAHGYAENQSNVSTHGNGAVAFGVAKGCEVHMSTGLASAVQGRNCKAFAAYSSANGYGAVAHMPVQYAQAITPKIDNGNEPGCEQAQYNRTITSSSPDIVMHTTPVALSGAVTADMITSFEIVYRMVLSSTPEDPIITTPDGITVTNFHLPSLFCAGSAMVDLHVVSPVLQVGRTVVQGEFGAMYAMLVTRSDMNGHTSHTTQPPPGIPFTNAIALFPPNPPPTADTTVTVAPAVAPTGNICDGFTIEVRENITVATVSSTGVPTLVVPPNIRIQPLPTLSNLVIKPGRPQVFTIATRTYTTTFRYSQNNASSAEAQAITTNNTRVETAAFHPIHVPLTAATCPTCEGAANPGYTASAVAAGAGLTTARPAIGVGAYANNVAGAGVAAGGCTTGSCTTGSQLGSQFYGNQPGFNPTDFSPNTVSLNM